MEQLRKEVPESLGAIIRRMCAKKPEERYQTPADVAQALKPFCKMSGDSRYK